jgi:hypothetical protein
MNGNDVCGSLMKRLSMKITLPEKQSESSAKATESRETDEKVLLDVVVTCGKA